MKKVLSKILISVFILGFFLAPISKVEAAITGLVLNQPDSITSSLVIIDMQVTGPLDPGEKIKIYLKTNLSLLQTFDVTTLTITNGVMSNINLPWSYDANTEYDLVAEVQGGANIVQSNQISFNGDGSGVDQNGGPAGTTPGSPVPGNKKIGEEYDYSCINLAIGFSLSGCIAAFLQIVWANIAAPIMKLGGYFLDFFVYYSTNSSSYTGSFVEKGWAVVRDVANLLFIIALLYVAFKIILNDTHSNPKKLIGMIIMMALVINFSLFFTRVVIDASNILAKIFYNNINSIDSNGHPIQNEEGEKSISVGMVAKFNPQLIVTQDTYNTEPGKAIYILTTIVLIAICLYAAYIFFSVGLLFVARVVSLWLAMIFSPIAFASNTVSFDFGSLGWKKWLSDLIGNAMLAPLFVFFLYMIVLFLNITNFVSYSATSTTMQKIMGVIIPFIVLAGLLQRAKKIAVDSSGEMGRMITSAGQKIGGFALGAATGGAAYLGTQTLGRTASGYLSNNKEKLQERMAKGGLDGWWAKTQLKTLDYGSKATFDARQTKLGNKMVNITGMDFQAPKLIGLGSKADGYKGVVDRTATKTEKEKELYKTSMSNDKVKAWSEERILKYQEDLAKATQGKEGSAKEQAKAAFVKINGNEPKPITSAEQLNKIRLEAFKENLGKSDLIGSLATSLASAVTKENFEKSNDYRKKYEESEYDKAFKKERLDKAKRGEVFDREAFNSAYKKPTQIEFDEKIAKEVTNDRISKTKMRIGAVTSLTAGAVIGNPFGAIGMGVGAIAGGLRAADQGLIEGAADKKVAGNIDKEIKKYDKFDKTDEKIAETKKQLQEQKDKRDQTKELKIQIGTDLTINGETLMTEDGKKISKEGVDRGLAKLEFADKNLNIQLQTLNNDIAKEPTGIATAAQKARMDNIQKQMEEVTITKNKLTELKSLDEKITNTEDKIADMEGKNQAERDKDKKPHASHEPNVNSPSHEGGGGGHKDEHPAPADDHGPKGGHAH